MMLNRVLFAAKQTNKQSKRAAAKRETLLSKLELLVYFFLIVKRV